MRRAACCFLILFSGSLVLGEAGIAGDEVVFATLEDYSIKRNYGYFMGDLVEVSYKVVLPSDQRLDEASLPRGDTAVDPSVEVKSRGSEEQEGPDRRVYHLSFSYRVFLGAGEERSFEIPPIGFLYGPAGRPSAHASALPPVPVALSPPVPAESPFDPAGLWRTRPSGVVLTAGVLLFLAGAFFFFLHIRRRFREAPSFPVQGICPLKETRRPC